MSEANKAVIRRLLEEVWGRGNLALIPELMAEDCVCHIATDGVAIRGHDEYRAYVATQLSIFGDAEVHIVDQLAEGDRVATRWMTEVQEDEAGDGASPQMAIVLAFHRLRDGKVAESWAMWDVRAASQLEAEPDVLDRLSLNL